MGDGYSHYPNRVIINEYSDKEIVDYVCKYFETISGGETCTYKENLDDKTTIYYKSGFAKGKNPIITQYKKYNLVKNKHIPKEIFESSLEYRLKVLAGIIDTDGYVKSKNVVGGMSFEIEMSRKNLIEEIAMLARSCGFRCKLSERTRGRGYFNGHFVNSQTEYTVTIKGDIDRIPTLIKRKQVLLRRISESTITKLDVEQAGIGEYVGITLEYTGKKTDNLFFLKDFTIVHNCGSNPTMRTS